MNKYTHAAQRMTSSINQTDTASADYLRLISDAIPLIVWTARPDGEIDYCNDQWIQYSGFSGEQTKGWGWATVLHPDDLEPCITRWTQAFTTGEPYEIQYRFKRASDQTYRWHLARAVPMRDAQGNILKWFGTATDIEDQVQSQQISDQAYRDIEKLVAERTAELAAANKQLSHHNAIRLAAVEALQRDSSRLNDIITTQYMLAKAELDFNAFVSLVVERMNILTSASGVVVEMLEGDKMVYIAASGSLASHVGLRLDVGNSLSGLCLKSREMLFCLDTEKDPRVNVEACRKVNARSMVVAPLFHDGEPVGVLKITGSEPGTFSDRDLQTLRLMAGLIGAAVGHQADHDLNRRLLQERTEAVDALKEEIEHRIAVEETVRANEVRTRLIIESSYDAFVSIDIDGRVTDWNHQAEVIFGWPRVEAIGSQLDELIIPHRYREAHRIGMKMFLTTGHGEVLGKRIELVALRNNGDEFPVELTIRAIPLQGRQEFCAFLRDITERKLTEQRLREMAENDSLTGVPNRFLFTDRLEHAIHRSRRSKEMLGLLYLDIDRFKTINDTYGHLIGDALLVEFARRLQSSVRATDTVARLGGDEFVVIVESLKRHDDARAVAEKIMLAMDAEITANDMPLKITTSIGIAFYDGKCDARELINSADKALYRAKNMGRNVISI